MPWHASAAKVAILCALLTTLTGCPGILRPDKPPQCTAELSESVDGWARYVALVAQLRALEQYPQADGPTQAIYVAAAQAYYAREYDLRLAAAPRSPAVAARLALQAAWRPGR